MKNKIISGNLLFCIIGNNKYNVEVSCGLIECKILHGLKRKPMSYTPSAPLPCWAPHFNEQGFVVVILVLWFSNRQLRIAGQNKGPIGAGDSSKNLEKPRKT
jgi:hypothetical protein